MGTFSIVIILIFVAIMLPITIKAIYDSVKKRETLITMEYYRNMSDTLPPEIKKIYDLIEKRSGGFYDNLEKYPYIETNADFYINGKYYDYTQKTEECTNPVFIIIDGYILTSLPKYPYMRVKDCSDLSIKIAPLIEKQYKSHTVQNDSNTRSVTGSAVVGGIIAGGAGAVVGAISAADHNSRQPQQKTVYTREAINKGDVPFITIHYQDQLLDIPCKSWRDSWKGAFAKSYNWGSAKEWEKEDLLNKLNDKITEIKNKYQYQS